MSRPRIAAPRLAARRFCKPPRRAGGAASAARGAAAGGGGRRRGRGKNAVNFSYPCAYRRFISQLIQRYAIIPLVAEDFETAARLTQNHPLRAYDAVQLAVALRYHRLLAGYQHTCIFVSGDDTLLTAARTEELSTDNPFEHVSSEDVPGRPV